MEIQHVFMICFGAYHIYRYADRVFDPKPVKKQKTEKKHIQYLVNEKEIDVPHHIYYKQMLDLYGKNDITDSRIREESSRKLEEIANYIDKLPVVDVRDVKAARSFLLDQWAYFVRLN